VRAGRFKDGQGEDANNGSKRKRDEIGDKKPKIGKHGGNKKSGKHENAPETK